MTVKAKLRTVMKSSRVIKSTKAVVAAGIGRSAKRGNMTTEKYFFQNNGKAESRSY